MTIYKKFWWRLLFFFIAMVTFILLSVFHKIFFLGIVISYILHTKYVMNLRCPSCDSAFFSWWYAKPYLLPECKVCGYDLDKEEIEANQPANKETG
jgi:Zn ribbon nucleic-acid-binding protein